MEVREVTVEDRMVDRFGHEPPCHTNGCPGLGYCATVDHEAQESVRRGQGLRLHQQHDCGTNVCTCITAAITAVVRLEVGSLGAQILEFHRPSADPGHGYHPYCVGCWDEGGQDAAPTWPCTTARMVQDWS